jgi:hypothetical protein
MWTSYKLIISQLFLLVAGLVFIAVASVALWIGKAAPRQGMPPFYGRVDTVEAAMPDKIDRLDDRMRLRWDCRARIYADGGIEIQASKWC